MDGSSSIQLVADGSRDVRSYPTALHASRKLIWAAKRTDLQWHRIRNDFWLSVGPLIMMTMPSGGYMPGQFAILKETRHLKWIRIAVESRRVSGSFIGIFLCYYGSNLDLC